MPDLKKYNEAYWKRKVILRERLCKLLDGYKLYLATDCGQSPESSRLVDCIDQIEQGLEREISWFGGHTQKEGHSIR